MLGFKPMIYGSEKECATHYTTAPHSSVRPIIVISEQFQKNTLARNMSGSDSQPILRLLVLIGLLIRLLGSVLGL